MSKELEALENIFSHWNCCNPNSNGCDKKDFEIIESALKELEAKREAIGDILTGNEEKKLKALDIIKKYICVNKPFGSSCYIYLNDESEMISQEEYDLLKEVLL